MSIPFGCLMFPLRITTRDLAFGRDRTIHIPRPIMLLAACACVGLAGRPAWGALETWTAGGGGLFNTPANWSSAVPGSSDVADFNLAATYTVTFQTNITNSFFNVDNGGVTFALGGTSYTTTAFGNGDVIGGIVGQTGQLTITNGKISGVFTVGLNAGATGLLTIGSDAVWNANGQAVTVGNSGVGTMTVSGDGQFVDTSSVTLGNAISSGPGNGTLIVTGIDSSFTSNGLTIGNMGIGHATISGGASATPQTVVLGNNFGAMGSLTVTGASSILDTTTSAITIGNAGVGHLTISDGATLNSGASTIANFGGSSGDVTITGPGSSWNTSGQLIIGNGGPGTLTISDGGLLTTTGVSQTTIGTSAASSVTLSGNGSTWIAKSNIVVQGTGTLTVGAGTTLTMPGTSLTLNSGQSIMNINGGTVDVGGAFVRAGPINLNDGTLFVRGAFTNGASSQALVVDGNISTAFPTLELIGNFTSSNITTITAGNVRQGALVLANGRSINVGANNVSIGASGGSNGSLTLSGASTLLTTTGITAVGGSGAVAGGTGLLSIGTGASLSTSTLDVYPGGTLILNSGGSVNLTNLNVFSGAFDFNSGTFGFTGGSPSLTSSQLDFLLGGGHSLGVDRTISAATTLTISGPMTISGGTLSATTGLTNGSTVTVTDGTLTTASTLTNNANELLQISGTGSVSAAGGITNNGTIQLNNNLIATSGGTLSNSGTIRGAGFVGNSLTNNASGQVQMTTGNRLEFEGATNTNTGLISLTGGELVFDGPLTNSAGTGLITGHDAIIRTGGITNNGGLAFTAGTMDVYGKITNNVGGLITCSGGGTTTFYDDVTIASGANSVRASAVGTTVSKVVFFGSYNGGIIGGGTAFIEGDHRPGNSPGVVSFGGDLVYGGLSRLFIDIGGTTPGNGPGNHDQVNVVGNVSIGGSLILSPYNGFVPVSGDKFVIMTYASETGTFAPVSGTTPAAGLTYNPVYLANSLVLLTTTNGEKTWGVDSDGNASVGSNWIGGVAPGGVGDTATFSTIITAPRVVTLDADTTVGTLKFDSPISYTIAGTHTLTLQAAGSAAATINISNVHGNGAHTISAPISLASDLGIAQNSGGKLRLTGPLNDSAAHAITKSGNGTAEISGSPTLGANTAIAVNGGTLRFALPSGSATIGSGVSVAVNNSATLELAGAASALAAVTIRANILNNSTAAAGILVSGTSQVVGGIDGAGATIANAGSSLMANHIVQSALVIGGTAANPGLVTIDASDASGNPLSQSSGFALASSLTPSGPFGAGSSSSANLSSSDGIDPTALSLGNSGAGGNPSPVPEPSTLMLVLIAFSGVIGQRIALRRRAR